MIRSSTTRPIWSLALAGLLLVGCNKEEDKSTGTGGGSGSPTTRPTTGPAMDEMDRMPSRAPTTQPGASATELGVPGAPDITATPGTPPLPGVQALPGAGDAEAAAARVLPTTRPTTRPTTLPSGGALPGLSGAPETGNK